MPHLLRVEQLSISWQVAELQSDAKIVAHTVLDFKVLIICTLAANVLGILMSYHVSFILDKDVEDSSVFFRKVTPWMLSPGELDIGGLLELHAFIKAKPVHLGEAFVAEDFLCMVL